MRYIEKFIQGNYSKGKIFNPEGIVLHHNYLTEEDAIKMCVEYAPKTHDGQQLPPASYHVLILKDGMRYTFAKDDQRAWHAGESEFKGRLYCNNYMLGACFHCNTNAEPLTTEQVDSFIEWATPRIVKFNIKKDWITDHRSVCVPKGRKNDLNPVEFVRIQKALKYIFL